MKVTVEINYESGPVIGTKAIVTTRSLLGVGKTTKDTYMCTQYSATELQWVNIDNGKHAYGKLKDTINKVFRRVINKRIEKINKELIYLDGFKFVGISG